jgi:cytochrome P450
MMRTPKHDVEMHCQLIPAGALVLPMIGSANRDPKQFPEADQFDISRHPNPHIAFSHGIHSCIGAALARLEARVALSHFLESVESFELASNEPWKPRQAFHVHGPSQLPIRFVPIAKRV